MRVLIVGGGIAGMCAAIRLAETGHEIELIDLDPEWRVYGAGITITGPTLRAYKRLGLLDQIKAVGAITNGVRLFRYDGTLIQELDEPVVEEGVPATGGIMRPDLHRIMQARVKEVGVTVRLGLTVDRLDQRDGGVDVLFSDGSEDRYDIVVAADGIASRVRALAFPHVVEPAETGQACWRISMKRPPGFERGEFYLGHDQPAGITACAPDQIYMWMLTAHEPGQWVDEANAHAELKRLIADFGGTVGWIRDHMTDADWVNYRPLAAAIQPEPWAIGRIVLVGDAAHATTPHLASGAGMAVEDALVLGEELAHEGRPIEESLLAYSRRRWPRCAHVVESSLAIGRLQLEGRPPEEHGAVLGKALHVLAEDF